jgi:hypothetical protein
VLKVQHKPIKRSKLGFKRKEQKKPKRTLVRRTGLSVVPPDSVRCTRGHTNWTLHLWVSQAPLRYNSPDCPVHQAEQRLTAQRSFEKVWTVREQCAQKSEQASEAHRTLNSSCPVRHQTVRCGTGLSGAPSCQSSNGWNYQNPNSWVTWLAHQTVRCAHRQTASPTVGLVVGAINTPLPPPLQESKFFRHLILYKS